MPGERALRVSGRVYKALLVLYPRQFRREYGPHMIQVFGDMSRAELRSDGVMGLMWLLARVATDLVLNAFAERSGGGRTVMTSSGLVRWCGIAAVLGGVEYLFGTMLFVALAVPSILPETAARAVSLGQAMLAVLLTTAGLVGFYALLGQRSRLGKAGVILVCVAVFVRVALAPFGLAIDASDFGEDLPLPVLLGALAGEIVVVGMLLLSVAALRTRAPGLREAMPLVMVSLLLIVLRTPLPVILVQYWQPGNLNPSFLTGITSVSGVGWVIFGALLWRGARSREDRGEGVAPQEAVAD